MTDARVDMLTGQVPGTDFVIRDGSGRDLYAFLGLLARAATAKAGNAPAEADAAGLLGLLLDAGLYGEMVALCVARIGSDELTPLSGRG